MWPHSARNWRAATCSSGASSTRSSSRARSSAPLRKPDSTRKSSRGGGHVSAFEHRGSDLLDHRGAVDTVFAAASRRRGRARPLLAHDERVNVEPLAQSLPHSERLIFQTDSVCIGQVRCPPTAAHFRNCGSTRTFCIVFPRSAVSIRRAGGPSYIEDPAVVGFYNQ